jgi:hypothetical protein
VSFVITLLRPLIPCKAKAAYSSTTLSKPKFRITGDVAYKHNIIIESHFNPPSY